MFKAGDKVKVKILYCDGEKALITEDDPYYRKVYLINIGGLVMHSTVKEMTLSEIEERLGCRVKIISEEE